MSKEDSLLINAQQIATLLGSQRSRFDIHTFAECDSTNTVLFEQARVGAPSGTVVITDHQKSGRGSRNRLWYSCPQASLTFSILWRFTAGMETMTGLSLAVGLAVAKALEACGARDICLKWPNDIVYQNKKLGGILIELMDSSTDADHPQTAAVCGIGLNLTRFVTTQEMSDFPLPVATLDEIISPLPDRHLLFSSLLICLAEVLDQFAAVGFAGLQEEWQARHAWQDQPVVLLRDGQIENEGICRGADNDGALRVQTSRGIERCLSGDLSLRVNLS